MVKFPKLDIFTFPKFLKIYDESRPRIDALVVYGLPKRVDILDHKNGAYRSPDGRFYSLNFFFTDISKPVTN